MAEPLVKVIKYNVGSSTDAALSRMQEKLSASTSVEAMRRSVSIADAVTDYATKGQGVFVKDEHGNFQRLVIS